MTSAGPFALPPVTIETLLKADRTLLLDPAAGPQVEAPGYGDSALQDVRLRGDILDDAGTQIGTIGWSASDTMRPWGILSPWHKKVSYPVTGQAWEEWDCSLHLALAVGDFNTLTSYWSWATRWDAELTQWFVGHRRFGLASTLGGDVYQELYDSEIRPFQVAGVTAFGLVCKLRMRNIVPANWGV